MVSVDRDGDFNFPLLMFGVAALFGYVTFASTQASAIAGIATGTAITVVYLVGGVFIVLEQRREDQLRRWLFTHANEIWQSGVARDGITVRPDTQLVTFPIGVGMLVLWFQCGGCPRFAEAPDAGAGKLGALLTTAFTGWWSIFGIIRAPLQIASCLRGGTRSTVQDYMQHLQQLGVTSRWQQRGELH